MGCMVPDVGAMERTGDIPLVWRICMAVGRAIPARHAAPSANRAGQRWRRCRFRPRRRGSRRDALETSSRTRRADGGWCVVEHVGANRQLVHVGWHYRRPRHRMGAFCQGPDGALALVGARTVYPRRREEHVRGCLLHRLAGVARTRTGAAARSPLTRTELPRSCALASAPKSPATRSSRPGRCRRDCARGVGERIARDRGLLACFSEVDLAVYQAASGD